MNLELSTDSQFVLIGDKLNITTRYGFEEDTSLLWSGLKLISKTPCIKELQISKQEIFPAGRFEAGEYIREKSILVKNNVIPTIEKRNLGYFIELLLRMANPLNPDDDLIIKRQKNIELRIDKSSILPLKLNPVTISISGLSVTTSKDAFKPGETIKINYTSENLSEIEIRLLQKANLICYCEAYGNSCRKVEELPPAIAGDVKTKNTEKGYLLLKIPEIAEPSHNYLWEPSEKEFWGLKYGDYSNWSLTVIGKKKPEFGHEVIKFNIPISIISESITEKEAETSLFSKKGAISPSLFDGIASKFQKIIKVKSIESDIEKYTVRIENISQKDLEGVTIKLSGLQEGLFETNPLLKGFKKWRQGEIKDITYESKLNISAIISILEDNDQNMIRIQTPVSSDFF